MGEEFDREAERERLREQYERDKQKRETTEQMSELLLQGATMTNGHCSECGDPIFRYDGQEFCPTCEKPIDTNGSDDAGEPDDDTDEAGIEVRTPSEKGRVAFGSDGSEESTDEQTATRQADPDRDAPATERHRESDPQPTGEFETQEDGLAATEQALTATLARFSTQAAKTEDPRKAKAKLEAAREAAETLAALQR